MKKLLLTIILMVPLVAIAQSDQAIMFEIGVGFGGSGKVTKTKEQLANKFNNKFCYHRPQSRMIYGAVRYRYERAETHIARWFNDADTERCGRDSWAVGLGYVLDTQDIDADGVDDVYATYTPGIAYTWGADKKYNVQDNTNTNWRLHDNWQMYNRVAVGTGDKDYLGEVAVVRYGSIISDYERTGESFLTVTVGARDYDSADKKTGGRGLVPPTEPANEFNIVVEDNTTIAPQSEPVVVPQELPNEQVDGGSASF